MLVLQCGQEQTLYSKGPQYSNEHKAGGGGWRQIDKLLPLIPREVALSYIFVGPNV